MKVKRYEALTLQEAIDQVKQDLGMEAVILHTRKFTKGGVLGFFGKNMVEVLAGLEDDAAPVKNNNVTQKRPVPTTAAQNATATLQAIQRRFDSDTPRPPAAPAEPGDLRDEVREMRDVIRSLVSQREGVKNNVNAIQPFPPAFGEIYLQLIGNDVEPLIAQEIIRSVNDAVPEEEKNNASIVNEYLKRHLKRLFKVSGEIELTPGSPKIVAFVGPTGVGKTTTIAKLATRYALSRKKKVGLITADTYRIAAVEQLKVYGDILDVPVKVVYNNEDMRTALDFFSDRDLVLIDTAGRSHRNADKLKELKDILNVHFPLEIFLVLNTNTRFREMSDIAERFRMLSFSHIIFTKLDEAATYGNILNVIARLNLGISYLCYGQSVPDEIHPATYGLLTDLTLGIPIEKCFAAQR